MGDTGSEKELVLHGRQEKWMLRMNRGYVTGRRYRRDV
jgi:hypothetical protein